MKCLVTGGAGFIGSNLVDRLIDDGHEVVVIDNLSTGDINNVNPKASFYERDLTLKNKWLMFRDVDVVFHMACLARVQPSIENPELYHDKNVNGLVNVLEACRKHNVKKIVFSSSSSVYGDAEQIPTTESCKLNPMSPYALHKLIGEQYCKLYSDLYGIESVSLRYFNVYGERQPTEGAYCLVMGVFAGQRLNGEPMTIRGDGENRRDFTYVGDVVEANILAAKFKRPRANIINHTFNIGNGDNRSVNQIANLIDGDRITVDSVIEPKETLADTNLAQIMLGWKPTGNLEEWIPKWKRDLGL